MEKGISEKEKTLFQSEIGKLNWLSQQSRPNLAFEVSYLGQSCKDMRRLIRVEKTMKKKKKNQHAEIRKE